MPLTIANEGHRKEAKVPDKLTQMTDVPSFQNSRDVTLCSQAVLDTVHVTVFDQSYAVSAGAMADTFFVANGD